MSPLKVLQEQGCRSKLRLWIVRRASYSVGNRWCINANSPNISNNSYSRCKGTAFYGEVQKFVTLQTLSYIKPPISSHLSRSPILLNILLTGGGNVFDNSTDTIKPWIRKRNDTSTPQNIAIPKPKYNSAEFSVKQYPSNRRFSITC